MWEPEHRAQFLVSAYQEVHATNRSIRERLYVIVNYSVTLFLVVGGFFFTEPALALPSEMKLFAAIGVILIVAISLRLLHVVFGNLMAQHHILASLEKAMQFHDAGQYLPPPDTLFGDATAEKLCDGSYYRRTLVLYRSVVVIVGVFCVCVILAPALVTSKTRPNPTGAVNPSIEPTASGALRTPTTATPVER